MANAKAVLALDVGNSRVGMACVMDGEASMTRHVRAVDADALGEAMAEIWGQMPDPKCVAASSVAPEVLAMVEQAAQARLEQDVLVVGRDLPLPIDTDLPDPESIGTDRLCVAAMAYFRIESACVVADFGTAITIDCVGDQGVFLGGAILPGLAMGASSLAGGTAGLSKVELTTPDWVFGRNTREAIVGGLVYGARGALRELVETYAAELGRWPMVIVTGGDAELVVGKGNEIVQAIVPGLCLMGVALAVRMAEVKAS